MPEHIADRRGVKELREALHEACEQRDALQVEVDSLKEAWGRTQERVKELWRINCLQLSEFDAALTSKEEEIAELRELCGRTLPQHNPVLPTSSEEDEVPHPVRPRRGRAPPVDSFTGERPDLRLDDWHCSEPQSGMGGARRNY